MTKTKLLLPYLFVYVLEILTGGIANVTMMFRHRDDVEGDDGLVVRVFLSVAESWVSRDREFAANQVRV